MNEFESVTFFGNGTIIFTYDEKARHLIHLYSMIEVPISWGVGEIAQEISKISQHGNIGVIKTYGKATTLYITKNLLHINDIYDDILIISNKYFLSSLKLLLNFFVMKRA